MRGAMTARFRLACGGFADAFRALEAAEAAGLQGSQKAAVSRLTSTGPRSSPRQLRTMLVSENADRQHARRQQQVMADSAIGWWAAGSLTHITIDARCALVGYSSSAAIGARCTSALAPTPPHSSASSHAPMHSVILALPCLLIVLAGGDRHVGL